MNFIIWIILGAVAGWIAEQVMKSSHGLLENIVFGIVGAFLGGFVFNFFGQSGVTGFNLYSVLVAAVGAIILIYLGRVFRS